ncbi:hypothetical protein [Demequina iriomotensis]|uniref:hypothetical protein n=1 Tax=Demequina iriomotensis TaxID=1536641 RepID=UPI0007827B8C|nr:hypothetical protein [Demequina iriomotensis]
MAADRVAAFRRQYGRRGDGSGRAGLVYGIYIAALVVLVYGGPGLRALAGQLHRDQVLDALLAPSVARGLSLGLAAATVAAFSLGTVRGPAVTRPFLVYALATSDLERRRAFGRTVAGASAAVVLGTAGVTAVLLVPVADAGAMSVAALLVSLGAALAIGAIVATAWLAGQVATGPAVWAVPLVLAGAALASILVPAPGLMPWDWAAAAWPVAGRAGVAALPMILLAVVALGAVASAPMLLAHLRGPELIQQARRWESTRVAATTGDLSTAIAGLRAAPTVGRRWSIVGGRSFVLAAVAADLAAPVRTPMRVLGALIGLGGGGVLLALAPGFPGLLAGLASATAALAIYLGLGPWCDGLAHAVVAISAPRLFGVSDGRLVLIRALAPLLGGIAVTGAAAVAAGPGDHVATRLGVSAAVVAVLVAVRLDASAKGSPPLFLTTPMVTPMGDLSVFGVLLWVLDAVMLAGIVGLAALGLGHGSGGAVVCLVIVAGWAILQWRWRLRSR